MARRISNIGYAQLHLPPTLELEAEAWSKQGWTGVTQTTHDLLSYWFNRDEDDLPKVFERIYRARQKRVIEVGGAGLGLSICQKLVEAHKGKIWIESKEGQGTTASFNLPRSALKKRGQCKKA